MVSPLCGMASSQGEYCIKSGCNRSQSACLSYYVFFFTLPLLQAAEKVLAKKVKPAVVALARSMSSKDSSGQSSVEAFARVLCIAVAAVLAHACIAFAAIPFVVSAHALAIEWERSRPWPPLQLLDIWKAFEVQRSLYYFGVLGPLALQAIALSLPQVRSSTKGKTA